MILLAHNATVDSYRTIEKYLKLSDGKLKDWSILSLKECKMFLENYLLDENQGFISTGLGGKNNKLRYFFLILSHSDAPFNDNQKKIIEKNFIDVANSFNSEIEEINFDINYAGMIALVSMDVAVGMVIEEGIKKCNQKSLFIFQHYFVTNCEIPKKEEIPDIIKKIME